METRMTDPTYIVAGILAKHKFTLSDERALQNEIAVVLEAKGFNIDREVRLSNRDCIDFMIRMSGIGIEVKIKGSAADIYRQCKRYCESDKIHRLILVTNRSMGLPDKINGKDCYLLSLGKSWL